MITHDKEIVERLVISSSIVRTDDYDELSGKIRWTLPIESQIPPSGWTCEVTKLLVARDHPAPRMFSGLLIALIAVLRKQLATLSAVDILDSLLGRATVTTICTTA